MVFVLPQIACEPPSFIVHSYSESISLTFNAEAQTVLTTRGYTQPSAPTDMYNSQSGGGGVRFHPITIGGSVQLGDRVIKGRGPSDDVAGSARLTPPGYWSSSLHIA